MSCLMRLWYTPTLLILSSIRFILNHLYEKLMACFFMECGLLYYFKNSMSFTYFLPYSNLKWDLLVCSSLFAQNLVIILSLILFRQGSHFNSSLQLIALMLNEHCAISCHPMNQIASHNHLHQSPLSLPFPEQFFLRPLSL